MGAERASERFRLGVNYWPSRTAMAWWVRFDRGEVAEDFARIAESGMDSVRCFLRWEDFQPDAHRIDTTMLDRSVIVADVAADAGLQIVPTLFTGHMSGVNWIPGWALGGTTRDPRFRVVAGGAVVDDGLRNWFSDADVARAQARLASHAARALAGHPALWAWDLGNENSNCSVPPDREFGRRWLIRMADGIRGADPSANITIGLHMEDLEQDRRLGPREAAEVCDFLTMHGYPIYATWARGATDADLVPFLAALTRWLGGGAEVLFSEFGLPTLPGLEGRSPKEGTAGPAFVSEKEAATYTQDVLARLRGVGASGAMLWCYGDYPRELWGTPPLDEAAHERSFGLWRADGVPKPAVDAVRAAGRSRTRPVDDGWIDLEPDAYWMQPATELPRLYARYLERARAV